MVCLRIEDDTKDQVFVICGDNMGLEFSIGIIDSLNVLEVWLTLFGKT